MTSFITPSKSLFLITKNNSKKIETKKKMYEGRLASISIGLLALSDDSLS